LAALIVAAPALAQSASPASSDAEIVVTGTRIPGLASTSPISSTSAEQIQLERAQTVEDFSVRLPQLAGGVNSTAVGSDAYGAQTLDLRNLGQNRTLVLINGTRAVPFSFRNAVDVNAVPAPLLKRVDILTGGAAAVYGADAVAGVVNFIIDTEYVGYEVGGTYERAEDTGAGGVYAKFGGEIGDKGNIVGYVGWNERQELLAGDRPFALDRAIPIAPAGGAFTDVASGRRFFVNEQGGFTTTPQTSDFTPKFFLVQPLRRFNASTFFQYEFNPRIEAYGRGIFSNVRTTGGSRAGQNLVVVDEVVTISQSNPFIPAEARSLLTFVNGVAQVRVNRALGELGVIKAQTERDTTQFQLGLRGPITPAINWDVYGQFGRTAEKTTVTGDALRNNAAGQSRFGLIANSIDIFGPGANLTDFGTTVQRDIREREQTVLAATIAGDTSDLFSLPAGPIGFAFGLERREETGRISQDAALSLGLTFRQGTELPVRGAFDTSEWYVEARAPLLKDLPFVQELSIEGAYRVSDYSNVGQHESNKFGGSWTISEDVRVRGTRQNVIRAPNIGEFAAPVSSIPFSSLVTVARLRPRYAGDPCVIGTGNAEQCRRFGAPAAGSYNSLDAANLRGNYFFGGNPNIKPEEGTTYTIGAVVTPRILPGFNATLDYYDIELREAVGQIQPIDALTSCYVTNPTAGNPLCAAVTRDPVTGFILNGFPIDRNLGTIKQKGFDVGLGYSHDLPESIPGDKLRWSYQASIVSDYTIQRNEVLQPVDCAGTYGFACSSDAVSLVQADYRHRATLSYDLGAFTGQLGWRRIGELRDSALGSTDKIKAVDYLDLSASYEAFDGVKLVVGVDNLTDEKPPTPRNAGTFNTYPDTYDVIGRSFGLSLVVSR
jgi:outer membrane receptor protein involved in Fe transport